MIRLDATTKIIQLVASDTAAVVVAGSVKDGSGYVGFSQETAATASTQTICAAPLTASSRTDIDHVTIKNTGGSNTVTVQMLNSSGAVTTQITRAVLAADETLEYTHATGWRTLDASGQMKLVMPGYLSLTGGTLSGALTLSAALTYGGVALTNAVTGAGKMVLENTPTLIAPVLGAATGTSLALSGASPQLTLGVLNTTSGGILTYGSTSGSQTWKPPAAAGAGVTITFPATSVTLNAAGDLTGTTLNSGVTASSLTSVGTLTSLVVTGATEIGGTAAGWGGNSTGYIANIKAVNSARNQGGNLRIIGTTAFAADMGGSLVFGGVYTGSTAIDYAEIRGAKLTGVDGNVDGYFAVSVRNNTTGQQEGLRITSTLAVTMPGTLGVTGALTAASLSTGSGAISGGAITGGAATFTAASSADAGNAALTSVNSGTGYNEFFMNSDSRSWGISVAGSGASGSLSGTLTIRDYTGTANRLSISTAGIVTMAVYGAGTATFSAAGVISSVSDERLKIKDGVIKNPIPMLMALEPGYFFGKPEANMGDDRQLGFYAQNVRKAIGPEAAPDPVGDKPWGYFDRSVLAVAIEATKNHESRLRTLEARLK